MIEEELALKLDYYDPRDLTISNLPFLEFIYHEPHGKSITWDLVNTNLPFLEFTYHESQELTLLI